MCELFQGKYGEKAQCNGNEEEDHESSCEKVEHCSDTDSDDIEEKAEIVLQGGFFNWSAQKMTKCQITCKSLQ